LLGFCKAGVWGHPCHRTLPTCVIGNVFEPFMILFMSELAVISFRAQFPKRSVHGGLTRYKTASPNRKLLCPKGLRKAADPPVRDRIGEHPPSNQSLTSAPQGLGRTSQERGTAQEGLGSVTITSNPVASTFTNSRAEPVFHGGVFWVLEPDEWETFKSGS
jgi:hypothetical protein